MVDDLTLEPIPTGETAFTVCPGPLAVIPARGRTAYITNFYRGTALPLNQVVDEVTYALSHETLHLVLRSLQGEGASVWFDVNNHELDIEIVLEWVRIQNYGSSLIAGLS